MEESRVDDPPSVFTVLLNNENDEVTDIVVVCAATDIKDKARSVSFANTIVSVFYKNARYLHSDFDPEKETFSHYFFSMKEKPENLN